MYVVRKRQSRKGSVVQQALDALPLSAEDIAKDMGVSVSLVRKVNTGEREPTREFAFKLAGVLVKHQSTLADLVHKLTRTP